MIDGERKLMGPWMTTALVVGGMIGSGIVLLPVSLSPLGTNAIVGWIVSGMGAMCIAAALAIVSRQGGAGIQANIETRLGEHVAYLVTFAFWVSVWVGNAAMAVASASAFSRIVPALDGDLAIALAAIAMVGFLQVVNAFGARATGGTAIVTVLIKILPLIAVVVIAADNVAAGRPTQTLATMPISFDNVATAAALCLFALLGFETATAPVGKIRDPGRTIPRAILVGTAFVAILYLLCTTAIGMLLPTDQIVASRAPFADAVGASWGAAAATLAAFAMAVSAFGALNGGVMIAGELGYSMAQRRDLPSLFTRVTANATPLISQIIASVLVGALILINSGKTSANLFAFVALLSTCATLYLYMAGCLAALRGGAGPMGMVAIAGGIVFIAFAFYGSGLEASLWSVALLLIGLGIRWLVRRVPNPAAEAAPAAPRE